MPKLFAKDGFVSSYLWRRGGKVNPKDKNHFTSEEQLNISSCIGIKDSHPCKNPVFLCKKCSYFGCDQTEIEICSEQNFKNGKCLSCGAHNAKVPLSEKDYKLLMKRDTNF